MYPRITSGEIIVILAPTDSALQRLVVRSEKSIDQIINRPEGQDVLLISCLRLIFNKKHQFTRHQWQQYSDNGQSQQT